MASDGASCSLWQRQQDDNIEREAVAALQSNERTLQPAASKVMSQIDRLEKRDRRAWRQEGKELLKWLNDITEKMAQTEKNVAITKVTGQSVSLAGGLVAAGGLALTVATLGAALPVTTPLVAGGLVATGAGAATSAGGDITKGGIVLHKKHGMKEKCQSFDEKTKQIMSDLEQIGKALQELSEEAEKVCKEKRVAREVMKKSLEGAEEAFCITKGAKAVGDVGPIGGVVEAMVLASETAVDGASMVSALGGVLLPGVGVAVSMGFSIWGIIEGAKVLQNGGSQAAALRERAQEASATFHKVDKILVSLFDD